MNWLSSLKNQTILLALVSLGVINGLLCGVMMLRENSNKNHVVRLEEEAKAAGQAQQTTSAELKASLEGELKAATQTQQVKSTELKTALDTANTEIVKLRKDLVDTSKHLESAHAQINQTARDLANLAKSGRAIAEIQNIKTNNPWLSDPKQRPPWDVQFEKLLKEQKDQKEQIDNLLKEQKVRKDQKK